MRVVGAVLAVVCGCYNGNAAVGIPCATTDNACPLDQTCDLGQHPPTCVAMVVDAAPGSIDAPAVTCPTGDQACPAAEPICDSSTGTCRGCEADRECPDDACIESTGQCVAAANVLYVSPTGTGALCTRPQPCPTISKALTLLTATQAMIRVGAGTYTDSFDEQNAPEPVVISGPSADPVAVTLNFTAGGMGLDHVIELNRGTYTVEGMTLAGSVHEGLRIDANTTVTVFAIATDATAHGGIDCQTSTLIVRQAQIAGNGIGINVDGGSVTIDRTLVAGATGFGIVIQNAQYAIVNSMIVDNAGGGVSIADGTGESGTFTFDTVANNSGETLKCSTPVAVADSIFAQGSGGSDSTFGGSCTATYSLFTAALPAGTGNLMGDPLFVGTDDFHIQPTSPAVDAADPAATDAIDFDGQTRPMGAGFDIGADEAH